MTAARDGPLPAKGLGPDWLSVEYADLATARTMGLAQIPFIINF